MGVILLLMLKYTGIGIWDILLLIVIALVISLVSRRIF